MKKWMIGLAMVTVALGGPAAAWGHEGHDHKVMGTLSAVAGNHLTVKGTDGKTVMVMLDAKTKITQGKNTVVASSLKVGDRVVAEGPEEKEMIMAATVKVGDATVAPAKKTALAKK